MIRIKKRGVAFFAVSLVAGGLTNRDYWNQSIIEDENRTQLSLTAIKAQLPPSSVSMTVTEQEDVAGPHLVELIDQGQPLRLQWPGQEPLDFSFRDFPLLADSYRTTLGKVGRLASELRVFEGRAVDRAGHVHAATLVLGKRTTAGVVRLANGSQVQLRGSDGSFEALSHQLPQLACVRDPRRGVYRTMSLESGLTHPDWGLAKSAQLEASPDFPAMASSGLDPVTGAPTLLLGGPANPPRYEASLKVATVIVALDKSATGLNSKNHLVEVTSQYLALMANVAAIYENQLGIRLLVQELILTPDSDVYNDIPFDENGGTLEEFADWIQRWRPEATYGQTVAIRFGDGLSGGTLGIAYQNALHTRNGVGVLRSGFGWALACHEMGHVFGSSHSLGGIMNAQYINDERSFFKDIEGQAFTAASQIYARSSSSLAGPSLMRNPEEMPFAVDDVVWAAPGERIRFDVLKNDLKQVYRGQENILSLAEVGRVVPRHAGSVAISDGQPLFTPSTGFTGTAWFSYSVQGDAGRGWLHKGDVAVVVGDPEANHHEIDLAAGLSRTLKLPGVGAITQLRLPKQAAMHEMISDPTVYILRVNSDANGSEAIRYRAGGKSHTLTLNYINEPPIAEPDVIYLSPGESVSFNPLANDHAAGLRGTFKVEPVLAVGTTGEGRTSQDYFPGGFRLVSARSSASRLGSLTVHRSPVMRDGRRRNDPNGLLTFNAKSSANGTGFVQYTIEDALGQRTNGTIQILVAGTSETLLSANDYVRAWVPTHGRDDELWTGPDFNDKAWKRGRQGAGYERGNGYQSLISDSLDFRSQLYNKNQSLYLRYKFDVDDPNAIAQLRLRMKYDDGFVAYLNGDRVSSANATPNPQWNSGAPYTHPDLLAVRFEEFDITNHRGRLRAGENILAIHGLNSGLTSSDMLIVAEIVATSNGQLRLPDIVCEPPADRTPGAVTLAGRLNDLTGGASAYFVWGKTDEGPDVSRWEHVREVTPDSDGRLRHQVDGIVSGSTLYYRLYAKNKFGTAWSVDTQKASTLAEGQVVARPDEFLVEEGRTISFSKPEQGVLANDAGATKGNQARLLVAPKHGQLTFRSDGTFDYQPEDDFSGDDRFLYRIANAEAKLERTVVTVGGQWRYYDRVLAPSRSWIKTSFDDGDWKAGPGLLGYGNGNEATVVSYGTNPENKRATVYFRQSFELDFVELIERITFKLLRDDAAAVYLNGVEVYRDSNLSRTARHTTFATRTITDENAYATFEVDGSLLVNGENLVAAEVHQATRTSSDLSFALFGMAHTFPGEWVTLTTLKEQNDAKLIKVNVKENPFMVVFGSELQKKYIIESSVDLKRWNALQVIYGTGGMVEYIPSRQLDQNARFFRIRSSF